MEIFLVSKQIKSYLNHQLSHYIPNQFLAPKNTKSWIFLKIPNRKSCDISQNIPRGHTKFLTRELVYYILFGTLRGSQKYHWPVLRVPLGVDNYLSLICEEIPDQILWLTKYLDSGLNSDLIKIFFCPNRMCLDCYR